MNFFRYPVILFSIICNLARDELNCSLRHQHQSAEGTSLLKRSFELGHLQFSSSQAKLQSRTSTLEYKRIINVAMVDFDSVICNSTLVKLNCGPQHQD